jgi:hypothetical protein
MHQRLPCKLADIKDLIDEGKALPVNLETEIGTLEQTHRFNAR